MLDFSERLCYSPGSSTKRAENALSWRAKVNFLEFHPDFPADGRRKPDGPQMQLKELRDHHQAVKRLVFLGMSNVEIAEIVGLSPEMVSTIRNSAIFRTAVQEMHENADEHVMEVSRRISANAHRAVDILQGILNGDIDNVSPNLQARIAQDMLNRAGHSPITKIQGNFSSLHGKFTKDDLDAIRAEIEADRQRAIDSAREQGLMAEEAPNVGQHGDGAHQEARRLEDKAV